MKAKLSCLFLVLCACAAAQTDQPKTETQEQPRTVYESSTVLKAITRLVVVDVVATDKNNKPVTNLKPSDFTIMEDGVPQQLRGFNLQNGSSTPAPEAKPVTHRQLPANIVTNIPEYTSDGSLNIILLDSLNTLTLDQVAAQDHALRALERFRSGRAVAVYALSSKLQVLHDFTNDPAELKKAITSFKVESSAFIDNPTNGPKYKWVDPKLGEINDSAARDWTEKRLYATLDAMNSLARALSGYPGRKNVIWVSGGFPQIINAVNRNYTAAIQKTGDLLSNAQVALYPVDATGSATSPSFQAQNGADALRGPALLAELSKQDGSRFETHGAMSQLADLTGGKTFVNNNDLGEGILRGIEDGSTYYILGYYPLNKKWNGKFRTITVKTNRSDVTLRYRTGYLATDSSTYQNKPDSQGAEEFGQALNLDFPTSTSLLFEAGILPLDAKRHGSVAINFLIDAHQLGFERKENGLQHANLDYAVEVYSEKGKPIKTDVSSIEMALPPEQFKQVLRSGFPYQKTFDLPPGNYILRLGIRDNRTGLIGSSTGKVNVSAGQTAQNTTGRP